jgi:hypothetical protein
VKKYYFKGISLARCCADTAARDQPVHGAREGDETLTVYTHLFADDHSDARAALGAMATPKPKASNVIPLYD